MASGSYDVLILGGGTGFGVTVPTREAGMTVKC
jgi:glycerol-3-phosphate dehydrogenase